MLLPLPSFFSLTGEDGFDLLPLPRTSVRLRPRPCFFFSFLVGLPGLLLSSWWSEGTVVGALPAGWGLLPSSEGGRSSLACISAQSCRINSILMVSLRFRILYRWFSGMLRRSSIASRCLSMSLGSMKGISGGPAPGGPGVADNADGADDLLLDPVGGPAAAAGVLLCPHVGRLPARLWLSLLPPDSPDRRVSSSRRVT
ncbi:hypothetical protein VTI74DRAFT_5509 [Chaetomium olivicolor]